MVRVVVAGGAIERHRRNVIKSADQIFRAGSFFPTAVLIPARLSSGL